MRLFPPRKPHSPWSKLNKARFERLTADGRMTKPGLDVIDEAKHNGARTAYDRVELLKMPRDLRTALGHNAQRNSTLMRSRRPQKRAFFGGSKA